MRPIALNFSVTAVCLLAACGHFGKTDTGQEYIPSTKAATRDGSLIRFPADSPHLRRIRLGDVEVSDVPVDEVIAPGRVELNPGRVSRVLLPVSGRVREVLVVLGDAVREGQPILVLESPEIPSLQSAYRQAEASVSQARSAVAKAEADLERSLDLLKHRAIAQKEVLAAETALVQEQAGLEQALAGREEALNRLRILELETGATDSRVVVRASMPGKVVAVSVSAGEYRSEIGEPVLTIADLSTVWVAADVPEDQIRLIQIGEHVEISLPAFPGQTLTGRVTRIGDTVDPETRTIKVRAELRNPRGQLRPEMFATIRHSHGTRRTLVVPRAAVFQQQERNIVYRRRAPGEFEEVPVVIVWQDERIAAIRNGLTPGDGVVVDGATLLRAY
jgi:cobalt-zinc-cadmium efflux system membrane fusion protein